MPRILVNGHPATCVAPDDRGLLFGDGVFRTLRVKDGAPVWWRDHLDRLSHDCRRLGLPCPDAEVLLAEVTAVAGEGESVVRVTITAGTGGHAYQRPDPSEPTRVVVRRPMPAFPAGWSTAGVGVRVCDLRVADQPALAGVKHLNRLENVLARREWNQPEIAEGLLLDARGNVIEGTATNVFNLEGGRLHTPDLARAGVLGATRQRVLNAAAKLGIETVVEDIPLGRLLASAGVFLTNSVIGLWPVARIDGRSMPPPARMAEFRSLLDLD